MRRTEPQNRQRDEHRRYARQRQRIRVLCATKWGEKGYTQSLKAAYKGSSVTVVGVYPGGIDTDFYRESHDYVSLDKQHTFMPAADLAGVVLDNLLSEARLTVSDILIERLYR